MSLDWSEFFWAFKNTLNQATISTVLSVAIGFFLSLGLLQASKKRRQSLQYLLMAPSLMPSILSVLCFYWYLPGIFQGIFSIALVHTLMNAGLVAVTLFPFIESNSNEMASNYFIYGIKKRTWFKVLFLSVKNNIILTAITIFVFCWGSLSVPLIVGGQKGTTIEVLIFEMIRMESDFKPALTVGLFQFLIIFSFSLITSRLSLNKKITQKNSTDLSLSTGSNISLFFNYLYIIIWFCPFLIGGIKGITSENFKEIYFKNELIESLKISALLTFVLLTLTLTLLLSYTSKTKAWFISQIPSISPNLIAIIFLFFLSYKNVYLLYLAGMVFLLFPSLLKLGGLEVINQSVPEKNILELYSVKNLLDRLKVLAVGNKTALLTMTWISFSWIFGDFVFARLMFGQDKTFALLIDSLLSHYRLEQAMGLALIMILVLFAIGFLIWSVNFVFDKKYLFKN